MLALYIALGFQSIFNESVSALYSLFIFGLFAAPEVGREVQEDQKKTAASLLENAREICIRHGVEILMILMRLLSLVKVKEYVHLI